MKIEFFLPMAKTPTITQQEHQVRIVNGKPIFYEPQELKAARQLLMDSIAKYVPDQPLDGPIQLITKWIWKGPKTSYKVTKPDTDNLIKMLKDCMTRTGYWHDDAQVASEITEKFWSDIPGIYVKVVTLDESRE